MSGTELIMGMEEVINYLKQLEAENKKLKETIEEKEIQEEHNKAIWENMIRPEHEACKAENKKLKEDEEMMLSAVEVLKFMDHKWDKKEKEWVSEQEYEERYAEEEWLKKAQEKETKYEEDDDWEEAYGYTIKDGEYRINISGNSADWKDYVITKDGCFIHNKEGKKKVFAFVSSAEGNYIKVWDTPDMEGGLVLDEGETDLYEIIKQSFKEEIMDYVKEDHFCISTDSDEEE